MPARDCRTSTKTMTCCRRWHGNWLRETESASTADAVWKALNAEHQKLFPDRYSLMSTMIASNSDRRLPAHARVLPELIFERLIPAETWSAGAMDSCVPERFMFGQRPAIVDHGTVAHAGNGCAVPEQAITSPLRLN